MIIDSGNIIDIYTECTDCNAVCYLITDCTDPALVYYTEVNMEVYVGKTIQYRNEDKLFCATVSSFVCREVPEEELPPVFVFAIDDCFDTCEECYPPKPPEPGKFELNQRTVKPGYDTAACTPAYWDKIKCKFSEAVYQHMASIRYGIEFCCNADMEKWVIKNELLDLAAITDPDICNETCDESKTDCVAEEPKCDPITGFYTIDLKIIYPETITEGQIIVNGQTFDVEESPQSVTLENLLGNGAPVDISLSFSESDLSKEFPAAFTAPLCDDVPIYETYQVFVESGTPTDKITYIDQSGQEQALTYEFTKLPATYTIICALKGSLTQSGVPVIVDGSCPSATETCTTIPGVTITTQSVC